MNGRAWINHFNSDEHGTHDFLSLPMMRLMEDVTNEDSVIVCDTMII